MIKEYQQLLNKEIATLNWETNPVELYEPMSYVLSGEGKRVRPTLVLIACGMFSNNVKKAVKPALAIELFHNFTLVHDDVMDHADMRRGKPSVHKKWNLNTALLSGDAMLVKAYEFLQDLPPDLLGPVLKVFNHAALKVCEGQQFDMNFETQPDVTMDEYIEMIELKTAVLIAAALQIGAIVAGAGEKDAKSLYEFGKYTGLSFQIMDDYLDVFGDQAEFGKIIGGDIATNKKTFLLIKAMEIADENDRMAIMKYIINKTFTREEKISGVTAIYRKLGVHGIAREVADRYYKNALASLARINIPDEKKEALRDISQKLLYRTR
jgi:geranylgeranyl diphosphate synthase type II